MNKVIRMIDVFGRFHCELDSNYKELKISSTSATSFICIQDTGHKIFITEKKKQEVTSELSRNDSTGEISRYDTQYFSFGDRELEVVSLSLSGSAKFIIPEIDEQKQFFSQKQVNVMMKDTCELIMNDISSDKLFVKMEGSSSITSKGCTFSELNVFMGQQAFFDSPNIKKKIDGTISGASVLKIIKCGAFLNTKTLSRIGNSKLEIQNKPKEQKTPNKKKKSKKELDLIDTVLLAEAEEEEEEEEDVLIGDEVHTDDDEELYRGTNSDQEMSIDDVLQFASPPPSPVRREEPPPLPAVLHTPVPRQVAASASPMPNIKKRPSNIHSHDVLKKLQKTKETMEKKKIINQKQIQFSNMKILKKNPTKAKKELPYPEGEDEEADEDSKEPKCCLCLTNKIKAMCMPCGHANLCYGCAKTHHKTYGHSKWLCMTCRQHVDRIQVVYLG